MVPVVALCDQVPVETVSFDPGTATDADCPDDFSVPVAPRIAGGRSSPGAVSPISLVAPTGVVPAAARATPHPTAASTTSSDRPFPVQMTSS